jgi:trigger factor
MVATATVNMEDTEMKLNSIERNGNQTTIVVEIDKELMESGVNKAYLKARKNIAIPGFRKGKAPRKVIEGMYGAGVFYEEALELVYPEACNAAIAEKGLDHVAPPQVEILTLGKEGFSFKALVTVRPEVTLKEYKGLEAEKVLPTVTEEAVNKELQMYVDRATQLVAVDRAAELGDTAVIDYVGLKDNVPFAGGTAQDYSLELGSNTFIPGFEDGVVGMAAGDVKDIELSFPETYHAEELAGAAVVFQVKCKEVKAKQPPVLDDEFAKDVSEFDTMEEFRASLKEKVIDRNMQQSEAQFRQALLGQLCDQIEIELPAAMVETQVDRFVDNYAARLEQQGISMDMYMQYMNIDMAKIREDLREPAILQTKQQLALDAVAAAEGIVISDEDVEAEVKKAAMNLGVPYERVSEGLDRENLKKDLARDKAMAVVAEHAKAKLVEVADNGEIEIQEITKEEVEAEKTEEKPKKKTTRKKKTEEVKEEKVEE